MKIRISESQLRQILRESIDEYQIKTDRKVVNKNKFNGTYDQINTGDEEGRDHEGNYIDLIPSYVVILSNFENEDTYWEFASFAQDRIGLQTSLNKNYGVMYFRRALNGRINQMFGKPMHTDVTKSADVSLSNTQQDPIPFSYSVKSKGDICPLEYDEYGYVQPKAGRENLFQNFERYREGEVEEWDLATAHDDKREVLFFFDDVAIKNNFVRAIKNMFWIAEHTIKNGETVYRFNAAQNSQFSIVEIGGEKGGDDPIKYLDPAADADLIKEVQRRIQAQQDEADYEDKMTDPNYLIQKAAEEEDERRKRAEATIDAYMPAGLYGNSAVSAPQKIGGTGAIDGLAEAKLKRMIRESIRKALNRL